MRHRIKSIVKTWQSDYQYSTVLSSAAAAFFNVVFTVFNGVLGIVYLSVWNGSICIYYLLLSVIRSIIVLTQMREKRDFNNSRELNRKVYISTHLLLILMDISLIVPIAVMVMGERSYSYGLIPAIAMAAYTTYRITMGIIHFCKSRKSDNLMVSELRMINLTDALLSLLTLQNALIIANDGAGGDMTAVSACTGAGIFIAICIITIRSFLKVKR